MVWVRTAAPVPFRTAANPATRYLQRMNIQRNNVEERQQRIDAILTQLRAETRPPARIRRVAPVLRGLVDHFQSIPITGRRFTQN